MPGFLTTASGMTVWEQHRFLLWQNTDQIGGDDGRNLARGHELSECPFDDHVNFGTHGRNEFGRRDRQGDDQQTVLILRHDRFVFDRNRQIDALGEVAVSNLFLNERAAEGPAGFLTPSRNDQAALVHLYAQRVGVGTGDLHMYDDPAARFVHEDVGVWLESPGPKAHCEIH